MKFYKFKILIIAVVAFSSCNYLDIVPDNVATIDYAFRMRSTAERYLFTCYSYLPDYAEPRKSIGFWGADEAWVANVYQEATTGGWHISAGLQNSNSPILSPWHGSNNEKNLWEAISQCNIFLENINSVPDMTSYEKEFWTAEVKFLKAFYHFELLRHFGPIPIVKTNIPVSASLEEVRTFRQPVDDVFNYIVELLDEAIPKLRENIVDENTELGRITKPIAMGMKAKILVYAASPLFNGNVEYENFTNKDGTKLFNTAYSEEKWQKAVAACKEAIDECHRLGYKLYEFTPSFQSQGIAEESKIQMNVRGTITERWNSEILWAHTKSTTRFLQIWTAPRGLEASQSAFVGSNGSFGTTLNMAYLFYSENGVPITEDKTWNYNDRFNLRMANSNDRYKIKPGYSTVNLHFNREPRFYGSLGFDGGIWYGNGKYDDANLYWLEMKSGQFLGKQEDGWHPYCGYFVKKYINYTNTATNRTTYTSTDWPWVMLRLGDLYLLYAEALNELNGPNPEALHYLDLIRSKAGIPTVENAWTNFSNNPTKHTTKIGLREIIHTERNIDMLFEGQRFWDLRRWKEAPIVLNQTIKGWDTDQSNAANYYRERSIHKQTFTLKDYFWPIRERDIIINKNLVQNPGW